MKTYEEHFRGVEQFSRDDPDRSWEHHQDTHAQLGNQYSPSRIRHRQVPPTMPQVAKYEMAAIKGCWMFWIWVEVEGVRAQVYNIIAAEDGPEAWIAVDEGKVSRLTVVDWLSQQLNHRLLSQEYTIHYSIRKLADKVSS
jgi:hypothetical protein